MVLPTVQIPIIESVGITMVGLFNQSGPGRPIDSRMRFIQPDWVFSTPCQMIVPATSGTRNGI